MENVSHDLEVIETCCCIAGGGPAGMMLGLLLARAGLDVVVLEKHADFLRDFRGDTIHPATLELMYELDLLADFLRRPHEELTHIGGMIDGHHVTIADFSHLPTHCKFIALMPQWEFLNFVAEEAKHYPKFHLRMESEVVGILRQNGCVTGVHVKTPQGSLDVHAVLTIGADGRRSLVRQHAGLEIIDLGAPIDVLWMRLSRSVADPDETLGRFQAGRILVTLNRNDYWQCAFVIPKGTFDAVQKKGLSSFRRQIAEIAPFLASRTEEIKDWGDVKLLTVAVDRLRQWSRPGLLCIGDSAHAMSPIGGVGINLAIQDAVAAANILAPSLLQGSVSIRRLQQVQRRREFPTRMTQRIQVFMHRHFLDPALNSTHIRQLPLPLKLLQKIPFFRRLPARIVGLGFRQEHVRSSILKPGSTGKI